LRRIGVLLGLNKYDPDTKARLEGFQHGLERLRWSEGRNVRIAYRFAPASAGAQVPAKELVALQPDTWGRSFNKVTGRLPRASIPLRPT
jgi:hypothetical protein